LADRATAEVLQPPPGQVVDPDHDMASGQQPIDQVGADEAGGAGDENAHGRKPSERSAN